MCNLYSITTNQAAVIALYRIFIDAKMADHVLRAKAASALPTKSACE
jgi:hypothetical protein